MKKIRTFLTTALLWLGAAGAALAQQSAPNWSYGYTPTPAEWNHWFAVKSDWPGSASCLVSSCTMGGPLITAASTASNAGFNVPPGTPPTAPNNGDVWSTTTPPGFYARVNGVTYNLIAPGHQPQGRITLTANTPVMTATVSGATTLRYDCYVTSEVYYFDGTSDQLDMLPTPGCEVTDAMVSAASAGQVVNGQIYDVWWAHSGANHICLAMSLATGGGGGWQADAGGSATSRGTGYTQLDFSTRPYITNKNAITNCFNGANNYGTILANQGTYLGTVIASAAGQVSYIFGSNGTGGTAGVFGICNPFNQVQVVSNVTDTGVTYTVTSSTIRQARAQTTMQFSVLNCLGTQAYEINYQSAITTVAVAAAQGNHGIGLDTITAYTSPKCMTYTNAAAAMQGTPFCTLRSIPSAGLHVFSANEASDNVNANTFNAATLDQFSINFLN